MQQQIGAFDDGIRRSNSPSLFAANRVGQLGRTVRFCLNGSAISRRAAHYANPARKSGTGLNELPREAV